MRELESIIADKAKEVDQIKIKQIMARLIGFLSGLQSSMLFDHGQSLPVAEKYESVIIGDYPVTETPQSARLKEKLNHLPSAIFQLMVKLIERLEADNGDISEYRVLRIILITMSFCFNFKQRDRDFSLLEILIPLRNRKNY